MKLLIDAGNTRIKWRLLHGDDLLDAGAVPHSQADALVQQFNQRGGIRQVWLANVAGEELERVWHSLDGATLRVLRAQSQQCGVYNGYRHPEQLGIDRWAALIAAWTRYARACLVVTCGTATTIDALTASAEFRGGLILPGFDVMRRSLSGATANLQNERGSYAAFPRCTADAIASGVVQATCGAIERQLALLDGRADIVLSGGAAAELLPHLNAKVHVVDNLVLDGISVIASDV